MHAWESIQSTLEYIEEHIGEEISIDMLSEIASLSPFYFQRLFSKLVKKPVREYIKLRRLSRAEEKLKNKDYRILDIALECGFNSHETFTRAFKEAYSMTPEQYRKEPVMLNQFNKPDLLLNYTMVDEGVPLISDGIVLEINWKTLKEPVTFMGFSGHVPMNIQLPVGETTGIDVPGEIWTRFHLEKHAIDKIPEGRSLGVAYGGDAPEGHFTYFVGVEVMPDSKNELFQIWELPAREYVVCGFEAVNFDELTRVALYKATGYCGEWMRRRRLMTEPFWPEIYFDDSPEGTYMELWFPANRA